MGKRAARGAQAGFDIGGNVSNGASRCGECGAPEYERHAQGCPLAVTDGGVVGADAGGAVLTPASPEAAALARELRGNGGQLPVGFEFNALDDDEMRAVLQRFGFNARLTWSTDAVGTWFFVMDGEQPLPLRVYGPDQAAERDRLLSVLQRAGDGAHTGDGHGTT